MRASSNRVAAIVLATTLSIVAASLAPAETISTSGTVESVVIFQNQARVSRRIEVEVSDAPVQLRVTGLPESFVAGSLLAEGDRGAIVRRAQVSQADPIDPHLDEVKQLEAEYEQLKSELGDANHRLEVVRKNLATLEAMVDFSARQTQQDLDRAVLDVEAVIGLTDFSLQRRSELAAAEHQHELDVARLAAQIENNETRLEELAAQPLAARYEAHLLVDIEGSEATTLRLRYDVNDCSWSPSYVLHAHPNDGEYRLHGNAQIVNGSGEDWKGVQLTLSTTSPTRRADAPRLSPLHVSAAENTQAIPETDFRAARQLDPFGGLSAGSHFGGRRIDPAFLQPADAGIVADTALNEAAALQQLRELREAHQVDRRLAADASLELLGATFDIDGRAELLSQPDPQTVGVFQATLEGKLVHILVPLLSNYAYRRVTLENGVPHAIMSGPADIYLDGKFVGRTEIPATAANQPLEIGVGADHQIRTRRELLDRTETARGGNRLRNYECRLVVSNLRKDPVTCQLYDRIPIAEQTGAVAIQLASDAEERLSSDALYQRMRRPLGILRWDLTIPPNTFGSNAVDIEYNYQIELERTHELTSRDLVQRILEDQRFQDRNMGGGMGGGMGSGFPGAP